MFNKLKWASFLAILPLCASVMACGEKKKTADPDVTGKTADEEEGNDQSEK
jgi:hypothetical protein